MQLTKIFVALMAAGAVAAAPADIEARGKVTQKQVDSLRGFANANGLNADENVFYKNGKLETTPALAQALDFFFSEEAEANPKRDLHEAPEKRTLGLAVGLLYGWKLSHVKTLYYSAPFYSHGHPYQYGHGDGPHGNFIGCSGRCGW